MPAPAADHTLTLHFSSFWKAQAESEPVCSWEKNLPQHLKAANTFSREFKSTFLPRLKPAAFPKERAKPSGLRDARGAAEGGRCRAPTASGPGTAVQGRGQTVFPRPGPSLVPATAAARPHLPHSRRRSGTRPRSGTGSRGGSRPTASRLRGVLSSAGPDPSRGAAKAPRHAVAGTGLLLRVYGQGGRDSCGERACGMGLCWRDVPAATRARLGRGWEVPEDAAGTGRDRGTHAHPLHCPRGCSSVRASRPCAPPVPARHGSAAILCGAAAAPCPAGAADSRRGRAASGGSGRAGAAASGRPPSPNR